MVEIMAIEAEMVPVAAPERSRRKSICQMFSISPMAKVITAPPNMARSTMILRPYRSESHPQRGEKKAMTRPAEATRMPAHTGTRRSSVTPSSRI